MTQFYRCENEGTENHLTRQTWNLLGLPTGVKGTNPQNFTGSCQKEDVIPVILGCHLSPLSGQGASKAWCPGTNGHKPHTTPEISDPKSAIF
jgi:hypothetical protein